MQYYYFSILFYTIFLILYIELLRGFMPRREAVRVFAIREFLYSVCFFIGIYLCLLFCLVCYCLSVVCNWEVGTLGV